MSKQSFVCVYNGYSDLHLSFDGRWFDFPQGKVTRMDDVTCSAVDEYKREHPTDPDPSAMLEYTFKAKEFGQMLFTRHNENLLADRCVLLLDEEPTPAQTKAADKFGRIRKMKQVERALAGRRQALAKGGDTELDAQIVEWMIEYDIKDELYNPASHEAEETVMVEAFAKFVDRLNQAKPELAGAKK